MSHTSKKINLKFTQNAHFCGKSIVAVHMSKWSLSTMKIVNNFFFRFLVLAQVLLILCINTGATTAAALASDKNNLDYGDLNKLANLETIIYGSAHKNLPNEKRVDSLEKIIFGKTHGGSLHARLFTLASTINGNQNSALSPPIAPSLDRSDTLKSSIPSAAPQSDWQTDENDIATPSEAKHDRITNLLQQAMQNYNNGQTNQAEALFKNVLSIDNANPDANFNLGAIAESRSDWQNALNYYQAALRANPNDQETKKAVQSVQKKLSLANQTPSKTKLSSQQISMLKAKVDQAASDYQKGNYDAAIANLKSVIAQAPDQADVYFALGQAYKAKGLNHEASSAFSQALNLEPNNKQYSDALAELNKIANSGANSTSNSSNDTFASNNNNANPGSGEITPFSDQGNSQLGWQPASSPNASYGAGYYMPGMNAGVMPGYTYSNYIPYSMTSRMESAAIGGLAGAAIGSLFAGRGYRMSGAMSGGMIGGMMGMMRGGRRW